MHEAGGIEQNVNRTARFAMSATAEVLRTSSFGHFRNAFALERGEALLIDVGGEYRSTFRAQRRLPRRGRCPLRRR